MRRLFLATLIVASVQSYRDSAYKHMRLEKQALSLRDIEWQVSHDRGSTVLHGPSQHTIVIRSHTTDTERGAAVEATRKVLAAYRNADLQPATELENSKTPGVVFQMEFSPKGKRQRYHRAHALLFGKERLIHAWHTAPRDEHQSTLSTFDALVASLSEE